MPAVTQKGSAVIKANNFVKTLPTGSAVLLLKRDRKACVKIFVLFFFFCEFFFLNTYKRCKKTPPYFLPSLHQLSRLVRLNIAKGNVQLQKWLLKKKEKYSLKWTDIKI